MTIHPPAPKILNNHSISTSDTDDDDDDYKPPTENQNERDLDSSDSENERETKKARIDSLSSGVDVRKQKEEEERKRTHAASLWENFQQSVHTPTPGLPQDHNGFATPHVKKMVKIEKKYIFAGEMVTEVVEVLEDSQDAKKWPRWQPQNGSSADEKNEQAKNHSSRPTIGKDDPGLCQNNVPTTPISTPPPKPPANPFPTPISTPASTPSKKPGPRKPKISLATPPSLLGGPKPKKLTTLDKSAMDWKAHVNEEQAKSGLKDDLEANKRGGGYLEKVEFLKRVEERKEGKLEEMKGGKRRRV